MKKYLLLATALLIAMTISSCGGKKSSHSIPALFTVTYDGNDASGGSVPEDPVRCAPGQIVTICGNPGNLMKTGFVFSGWNQDRDGRERTYTAGETFAMERENVILYAQWTLSSSSTCNVRYDLNGGTGTAPADGTHYEEGSSVVVSSYGDFSYPGFFFTGWTLDREGRSVVYAHPAVYTMRKSDAVFYARWLPVSVPSYTVTYDGNAGDGGTSPAGTPIRYTEGSDVTVSDNTGNFMRKGFIFGGWFRDGEESVIFQKNDHFLMGRADTVFRVHWIKTYSVSYDLNGGTGPIPEDATFYKEGDRVPVIQGEITREEFFFGGWTAERDGAGTAYSYPGTCTMGKTDLVLYAKWTPAAVPTYTVCYDLNGGAGTLPVDTANYTSGATVSAAGQGDIVRDGYTFEGWTLAADDPGTVYRAGTGNASFVISCNTVLYAKWSEIPTFTVSYASTDSTGGTAPSDESRYIKGSTATVLPNSGSLVRAGWTLVGWTSGSNAEVYREGSALQIDSGNIVLEPKWAKITASAEPSYIETGQLSAVTVRADLNSFGSLIPSAVSADLSCAGGGTAVLYDDGDSDHHGDSTAGDRIYSCRTEVTAQSAGMKKLKIEADAQGTIVTGFAVLMTGLAFSNSDMEADMHAAGKVGSVSYALLPIASYESVTDRNGNATRALHVSGVNTGAAFVFTSSAPLNPQGNCSKISFRVNGSIKVNGAAANKSISCQIGSKGSSAGTQLFPCGSIGSSDITVSGAASHSYTGNFDTGGNWVKVTLNLAGAVPTQTSGPTYADAAGNVLFSIKTGGTADAVCDFWIDDIVYER